MWVKLDDAFCDHPKVVAAGPLAGWLFVAGLCYSNRLLTDGFIPEAQVDRLLAGTNGHRGQNTATLATKLCSVGLWKLITIKGAKGFQVHDYLKYQPSRRQVLRERKKTAERQARWRHKATESETGVSQRQ